MIDNEAVSKADLAFKPGNAATTVQRVTLTRSSFATNRELVAGLEAAVARGRAALVATTDDHLMTTWRMLARGHVVAENPRH